jgi:hypothetical protein
VRCVCASARCRVRADCAGPVGADAGARRGLGQRVHG